MTFEPEPSSVEHYQDDLVHEDSMASVPINYYKRALWLTSAAVALSLIVALGIFKAFGIFGIYEIFAPLGTFGVIPLACTFGYLAARNAAQALRAGDKHKYFKTLRVVAFAPFAELLSFVILISYLAMDLDEFFASILIDMVPTMVLGIIVALLVGLFVSHKLRKNSNDTKPLDGKTKIIRVILLVPITITACVGGFLFIWILATST